MKTQVRVVARNAYALLLGLVGGVYLLEFFGSMLLAWSWWQHRAGVDAKLTDALVAAGIIAMLALAPLAAGIGLVLERTRQLSWRGAAVLAIAGVACRAVLIALGVASLDLWWATEILHGKRTDLAVGTAATIVWFVLVRMSRGHSELVSGR